MAPQPIPVVRAKLGVQFTTIAPAGFAILAALYLAARMRLVDLTITSACDGAHSGPDDPHLRGEAYDVRTHGLSPADIDALLSTIMVLLREPGEPVPTPALGIPRSLVTERFFGFLEQPGTDNEHLHIQRRRGQVYG